MMHYRRIFVHSGIVHFKLVDLIMYFFLSALRTANENMDRLMTRLERLSMAIGQLNPSSATTLKGLILQLFCQFNIRISIFKISKTYEPCNYFQTILDDKGLKG